MGAKRIRLKRLCRLLRAEVVRRPRSATNRGGSAKIYGGKTPDKTIRAKNMVKGIAPVVPIRPAVVPMALAA